MLFNTLLFILIFLPINFVIYWILPRRWRRFWLLIASLVFYAYAGLIQCILLLSMIALTYFSARYLISNDRWRFLGIAFVFLNLLILVGLKYVGLFLPASEGALSSSASQSLFGIAL